jgi:hypothetical protein
MAERQHARLDGALVTILTVHGRGKNAKVDIRDQFGFPKTVKASELDKLPKDDPQAVLRFGDND